MLPWIMAASLSYGMLALFLALVMGGYQPIRVVERGGWKAALGMSRGGRSASVCVEHEKTSHHRLMALCQHWSIVE